MTMAKEAISSTFKNILIYTAEIIASIILLVVICIPLAFAIPGWFQHVVLEVPKSDIWINPVALFGADVTILIISAMAIVSIVLGYPLLMKLITSSEGEDAKPINKNAKEHEGKSEQSSKNDPIGSSDSQTTENKTTEE